MACIVFLILLDSLAVCVCLTFFSLQSVQKEDLSRKVESPNGEYVVKTYFHYDGSSSSDAVRGELVSVQTTGEISIVINLT